MEWVDHVLAGVRGNGASFVIGVLILVFGSSAILSERTAKEKFGALGMIARWVQSRKERAAELEEELFRRRTEDLWAEIRRVDESRSVDKDRFLQELRDLRRSESLKHRYTLWAAQRVRDLEIWAATNGLELPTPKILPFLEWIAEYVDEDEEGDLQEDDYD